MDPDTAQDVSTGPQSPELVVQGTQTSDLGHNLGVHLPGYPDPEHNPGGGLQRYPDSHCVHGAPQSIRTITWRGQLPPPRNPTHPKVYSRKVFLGGIPHNITEGALLEEFGGCGPVKVEWPHRSRGGHVRRGPASDLHPGPPPRRHHHLPHGAFHNQAPKPEGVGDALGGGRLRLCYQGVPVGEELLFVCPSSV
ncbi:cytoplasmic polyadenylation element-binding protein 1-like isoform X1 [Trichomycterus rosablanca]|uniref:cytoplasmic polyadenylation element-binding protein 1-like isoform X1 n=1 Tax=Trichomycterus rosablanca TaxID=2290929 RepID=UPI002F34F9C4